MIRTPFVPVVDKNQQPLMPTTLSRAKRWIASRKATPFWKKGVFCVRLNVEPSGNVKQEIAVGIDPGSKKEGFTVKSAAHTFLNIQADAVTDVKGRMDECRNARCARRYRKTPCRQPRANRACLRKDRIPPSTKARWQWKLRVLVVLRKMFPVTHVIVEDIKAVTNGQEAWDKSFSPLEIGKSWFYSQIFGVQTKQGYETKELRDQLGLKKSKAKLSKCFEAHCVDSWVLANSVVGGHLKPDNKLVMYVAPLRFYRRSLHWMDTQKGGARRRYGGTMSLGLKRGSIVRHKKIGIAYVGGNINDRLSLHAMSGERLGKYYKTIDCKFVSYNSWKVLN